MFKSKGEVIVNHFCEECHLTSDEFYNGIYYFTRTAIMLGMNDTHHSRFLAMEAKNTVDPHPAEFVWNQAGRNMAMEKADYVLDNHLTLVGETAIGETRVMWPGMIVLEHRSDGRRVLIVNSGVPAFMDMILIAAFAIGLKDADAGWEVDEAFAKNSAYAQALETAAVLCIAASECDVNHSDSINCPGWHGWMNDDENHPNKPMPDILRRASDNFSGR